MSLWMGVLGLRLVSSSLSFSEHLSRPDHAGDYPNRRFKQVLGWKTQPARRSVAPCASGGLWLGWFEQADL
jgi:hypothetical protein